MPCLRKRASVSSIAFKISRYDGVSRVGTNVFFFLAILSLLLTIDTYGCCPPGALAVQFVMMCTRRSISVIGSFTMNTLALGSHATLFRDAPGRRTRVGSSTRGGCSDQAAALDTGTFTTLRRPDPSRNARASLAIHTGSRARVEMRVTRSGVGNVRTHRSMFPDSVETYAMRRPSGENLPAASSAGLFSTGTGVPPLGETTKRSKDPSAPISVNEMAVPSFDQSSGS